MNLLMMAPLIDSRGNTRYFIGAQVDVSGLVKQSTDLEALQHLIAIRDGEETPPPAKDEFQDLSEMFNNVELDTVRKYGGNMHQTTMDDQSANASGREPRPRVLIKDMLSYEDAEKRNTSDIHTSGRLAGVYKNVSCPSPVSNSSRLSINSLFLF